MKPQDYLKAICMHLPYGVKCIITDKIHKGWMPAGSIITFDWDKRFMLQEGKIKLLLTPLSEITKEIEVNGKKKVFLWDGESEENDDYFITDFIDCPTQQDLKGNWSYVVSCMNYHDLSLLLEHGFDVFGLIGKYALDKTKLK